MQNQAGAALTIHTIADGQAEAIEFLIDRTTLNCGIPLKKLKTKLISTLITTISANRFSPNCL
jgi:trk system potassium uptake protein TrkA